MNATGWMRPAGVGRGFADAPEALHAYLRAAAMLSNFDPMELRPLDGADDPKALEQLLELSEPVFSRRIPPGRWQLPDSLRRSVLRSMRGTPDLHRAVAATTATDTPEQGALRRYVEGAAAPIEGQSVEELRASAQAVAWLDGVVDGLPSLEDIGARLALLELLAPLRRLVGDHFAGREEVLDRLADHVAVLPPGSRLHSVRRRVREVLSLRDHPPLCLWGPGGVGKSTVLAKFVLDHVDLADDQVAFVYVDLDRAGLTVYEPLTLLHDGLRQLALQFPSIRDEAEELRQEWAEEMEAPDVSTYSTAVLGAHHPQGPRATGVDRGRFYAQFARLVAAAAPDRPLLFVVDTFEMAQRRGADVVADVWAFLDGLQAHVPTLRVVVAGRKGLREDGLRSSDLALTEFDPASARAYLSRALGGALAPDDPVLRRVVTIVGRNPLSLGLAAQLLQLEGVDALRAGEPHLVFLRLHEGQLQGVLYRRILDHIEDPVVKKLAYPGLEVRRITPGIVRHVLAGPCGLDVPDDDAARELVAAAAREVTLLDRADDGSLVHRPDVRRQMLATLRQGDPARVRAIDEAAVAYYAQADDLTSRAEEIYHRLVLDQPREVLDARWLGGIEHHLWGALEELSPNGAVYLASRLGTALSPELTSQAEQSVWERHAQAHAARLLEREDPAGALAVLRERTKRLHGSPLLALEARALEDLGRFGEASHTLRRAGAEASDLGHTRDVFRALYGQALLAHRLGDRAGALARLEECRVVAARVDEPIDNLRLATLDLLVHEAAGDVREMDRVHLAAVLADTPRAELRRDRSLLAEVAAAVGGMDSQIIGEALRAVGLQSLLAVERRRLAQVLARWDARLDGRLADAAHLPPPESPSEPAEDPGAWELWLEASTLPTVAGWIASALSSYPGGEAVSAEVSRLYRAWLDEGAQPSAPPPQDKASKWRAKR
ncbi:ATP-binding protein [Cellulomonas dongxiuzhuiae]|uniref:ATP-binding protein n=1 Tax=Cellulomonas dongxiuzhuiae TaxID=2819979 RepID=A0ABX8GG11_9CELL|nr:ATP-binding protein [Cellulomonas dongxiuzhuiae]MBO3093998.1 ATP-binding protein [Cellulomonas dongxiuzhuiae]QWC15072.1 ATP-binding protein [Cellulomonas dongxiuzhuiae]